MPPVEARSPSRPSNAVNARRRRPVTGQQRAQSPPRFALCRHIAGYTQGCN